MNKNKIIIVMLCTLLSLLLLESNIAIKEFLNYTNIFIKTLFPSCFIFLTISSLLLEYHFEEIIQKILKTNSIYLYLFFSCLLSGFPSGSIFIKELLEKGTIEEQEANQIIKYTHFPNPLFIIHTIAIIINSKIIAYKILLSIVISNLIILIQIPKKKIEIKNKKEEIKDFSKSLKKAIKKTTESIIIIYGISIFFCIISAYLSPLTKKNIYLYVLINGFFDLTKGINLISLIPNIQIKYYLMIIFISFGSLSIHIQTKSILADTNVKYKNFVKGRILGTILSLLLFQLMMLQ